MSAYTPPTEDLQFIFEELIDLDGIRQLPGYEEVYPDLVEAILSEAAKVCLLYTSPSPRD